MAAALNRRSLIGAAGKPSNAIGCQESCDPPLQPSLGCPRMEEGSAWSGDGCHPTSPQLKYACYPPVESTSSQFTNPP